MYKQEFMARLNAGLAGLPQEDIAERLAFYSEMIDDRMEEGMPEEQAVACAGNVDDIVAQVIAETPFAKLVKERARTGRRLGVWEIVLLVLGFPLWFPLLLAAFVVVLALYICVWAVVVSLWAVDLALAVGCVAGVVMGAWTMFSGDVLQGVALISLAAVCAGLAIILFFGCREATVGAAKLAKNMVLKIKSLFVGKERVQ